MISSLDGNWFIVNSKNSGGYSIEWILENIFYLKNIYFNNGELLFSFGISQAMMINGLKMKTKYLMYFFRAPKKDVDTTWFKEILPVYLQKYFPHCELKVSPWGPGWRENGYLPIGSIEIFVS